MLARPLLAFQLFFWFARLSTNTNVLAKLGSGSHTAASLGGGGGGVSSFMPAHSNRVVNVDLQKADDRLAVSGAVNGEIKLWDLRKASSPLSKEMMRKEGSMSALAIHPRAPLLASGSAQQHISVFNCDGETLNVIRHHYGLLGQRIGPITSLIFHPYKTFLAAGATDELLSIHGPRSDQTRDR